MTENRLSVVKTKIVPYDNETVHDVSLRSRVNALEQTIATLKATVSILMADKQNDNSQTNPSQSSFLNRFISNSDKENQSDSILHSKVDDLARKQFGLEKELRATDQKMNSVMKRFSSVVAPSKHQKMSEIDIENLLEESNDRTKRSIAILSNKIDVCNLTFVEPVVASQFVCSSI